MKKEKKDLELVEKVYISKLEKEIKDLKRENEKLRKQLSIVDFFEVSNDRRDYLEFKRIEQEEKHDAAVLKEKWICYACGRGSLHVHVFRIPNNIRKYYRACPRCNNKTPVKDYHDNVRGIFANKKDVS